VYSPGRAAGRRAAGRGAADDGAGGAGDAVAVGERRYKEALRLWASGVSVVTAPFAGNLQAITVSSFTSVSLEPPLILVCIENSSRSHPAIEQAGRFVVNVLAAGQEAISDMAAGRRGPEGHALPGVGWRTEVTGAPVLEGVLAWLDCTVVARYDGGDHGIFLSRVEAAGTAEGAPLLWFDRGYRRLTGVD
jgi:3-hydroxy-9,10-secoandrosta-1,3,5(10)-triene-9,17-dione monooxygenase reductase component